MDVKDGKKIILTMTREELEAWKERVRAEGEVTEEDMKKFFTVAIQTGIIVLKD
jgi:hypothetical protein